MKNVLLSIKPQFVEKILNGEKTIEIRKTKPNIETPFKCYIYCTLQGSKELFKSFGSDVGKWNREKWFEKKGRVVAEFICNQVDLIECDSEQHKSYMKKSCLTLDSFIEYCNGKNLYAWHISDLVIYDKPKELSSFYKYCGDYPTDCDKCNYGDINSNECVGDDSYCASPLEMHKPLSRPPQSWGYVEELKI